MTPTERESVEHALSLLDELRNTAIPVARQRDEMLAPARAYLKSRLASEGCQEARGERSAALASLAAVLLITDPRKSQHGEASRQRVLSGYHQMAAQLLELFDVSLHPDAAPGRTPGVTYTLMVPDDERPFITTAGEGGPPGFVATLHDALVAVAAKGLANVVAVAHAEMLREPELFAAQLRDAKMHAANLVAWVQVSARTTADPTLVDAEAMRDVAPEALDEATRTERERVLALARQVARDCPMGPIVASAFQTLQQDIANGETPEKPRRRVEQGAPT